MPSAEATASCAAASTAQAGCSARPPPPSVSRSGPRRRPQAAQQVVGSSERVMSPSTVPAGRRPGQGRAPPCRGGQPHRRRVGARLDELVCPAHNQDDDQPAPSGAPLMASPPHPRATRAAGRQMRRALLDAAERLFAARGLADVSAAEIAREAGAFPSQITYYFGSKEALFVEAACRSVLHVAADVERAGARTRTPRSYVRDVVRTALASPALLSFAEAALLVRRRPELAAGVRDTFARLHLEGERAVAESLAARGWQIRAEAATE